MDKRMCYCGVYVFAHPTATCATVQPVPPMSNEFEAGYRAGRSSDHDWGPEPTVQNAWNDHCVRQGPASPEPAPVPPPAETGQREYVRGLQDAAHTAREMAYEKSLASEHLRAGGMHAVADALDALAALAPSAPERTEGPTPEQTEKGWRQKGGWHTPASPEPTPEGRVVMSSGTTVQTATGFQTAPTPEGRETIEGLRKRLAIVELAVPMEDELSGRVDEMCKHLAMEDGFTLNGIARLLIDCQRRMAADWNTIGNERRIARQAKAETLRDASDRVRASVNHANGEGAKIALVIAADMLADAALTGGTEETTDGE